MFRRISGHAQVHSLSVKGIEKEIRVTLVGKTELKLFKLLEIFKVISRNSICGRSCYHNCY
jgi:hypothetical protein